MELGENSSTKNKSLEKASFLVPSNMGGRGGWIVVGHNRKQAADAAFLPKAADKSMDAQGSTTNRRVRAATKKSFELE